jgi:hypothetical protein
MSRQSLAVALLTDRTPIMSYHFAWPGYGHIVQTGEGFHYYPEPMQMLL